MYPKISIIILSYNAPLYTKRMLQSLSKTNYPNYEVVVFDNNSSAKNRMKLKRFKETGYIDKLIFSNENLMFIKGNNKATKYIASDASYILLLNSDVEIRNTEWLSALMKIHKRGITATDRRNLVDNRPDGWCLLIDSDLYLRYQLDEKKFDVYFSCADLSARILNDGFSVQTICDYDNFIFHFGSASGKFKSDFKKDKNITNDIINNWFKEPCHLVDCIFVPESGKIHLSKIFYFYNSINKVKINVAKILKKYLRKAVKL